MGFIKWFSKLGSFRRSHEAADGDFIRTPMFEDMERRYMFNATPIHLGSVYLEADSGGDHHGDTFEIKFEGGAPGTQLKRLEINGDHGPAGLSFGDMIFDTVKGGLGADEAFGFQVVSSTGIDSVKATVEDGSSKLVLDFTGFDVGEKLVFSIDVDEVQDYDPAETDLTIINQGIDPIASGVEFQGSQMIGSFVAPHFVDATATGEFRNVYDDKFAGTTLLRTDTNPNGLRRDNDGDQRDRSAGAPASVLQQPKPISISGRVYLDNDLDLKQSNTENGIAGVQLSLWKREGNAYADTGHRATTNNLGDYRFGRELGLLPGTYQIRETQPENLLSVGAVPGQAGGVNTGTTVANDRDVLTEIEIPWGDTDAIHYDFAEAQPAEIAGTVYVDTNNDGVQGSGERGIAGVTLRVVPLDSLVSQSTVTVMTDAQGRYVVRNLSPGTYRIEEDQPTGYYDGLDSPGTVRGTTVGSAMNPGDRINGIQLRGGDSGVKYDFGELEPGTLSGHVFADFDEDCRFTVGDTPLAGVTVRLYNEAGDLVAATTTNDQGYYQFVNLAPGVYTVREDQPPGYFQGSQMAGSGGGIDSLDDVISSIVLASGEQLVDYDFCEVPPGSVSGWVHVDNDRNLVFDAGEKPLANVQLELLDSQGQVVGTTQTDATGHYSFNNLRPDTYSVREQQPAGYYQGGQVAGSGGGDAATTDVISNIRLPGGKQLVEYNFCEIEPGSIEGIVHVDNVRNCLVDPGEPGVPNVRIELINEQGVVIATTTTDSEGRYRFGDLAPGKYAVREQQPAGYFHGGQEPGSGGGKESPDLLYDIPLAPGAKLTDYNFCELLPGSIEGIVHVDSTLNGQYDAGEQLLSGVKVDLLNDAGELLQSTTTNASGHYKFTGLAPGKYMVRETQPSGYFQAGQSKGTGGGDDSAEDLISDIKLTSGAALTDYNFREALPGKISGYVFQDGAAIVTPNGQPPANLASLRDGKFTPDDKPLAGVTLELRYTLSANAVTGSDTLPGTYPPNAVLRATTNAQGYYEFVGLPRGNYTVLQVQPVGYFDGLDTAGSTGGVPINPSEELDTQILLPFTEAGIDVHNDALLLIPLGFGGNSASNNFSEVVVQRAPEPPTQPPFVFQPPTNLPVPNNPTPAALAALAPALPTLNQPLPPPAQAPQGGAGEYTWHLSVMNGGTPRGNGKLVRADSPEALRSAKVLELTKWQAERAAAGRFLLPNGNAYATGQVAALSPKSFGLPGATPLVGDFNGDGLSETALFIDGEWFIDVNGNGEWDAADLWAKLGAKGDMPVVGDWDGDGKDDIGIFGRQWARDPIAVKHETGLPDADNRREEKPLNVPPPEEHATDGVRQLQSTENGPRRGDLIDHVFQFGVGTDAPVAGDFNGDGVDTVGVFSNGTWRFDTNGDGELSTEEPTIHFGQRKDIPIVGDFDGDGVDEIGVYRNGQWIIDMNHNGEIDAADKVFELGDEGDVPLVGDFDRDGVDEPALYRPDAMERTARR